MKWVGFSLFMVLLIITARAKPDVPESCKGVVSRSSWGARVPIQIEYQVVPVQYVVVHHTVTPTCSTETGCSELLKNMQNFHMDELEYYDIGYNFIIGGDGKVYEGVGYHKVAAHTRGYNTRSLGIAFVGNFQSQLPPEKQLQAAKDFLQCAVDLGELDSRYKLIAGRQVSATQSPGLKLYHELQNWPHFTRSP